MGARRSERSPIGVELEVDGLDVEMLLHDTTWPFDASAAGPAFSGVP
jgi:hypothetical protein